MSIADASGTVHEPTSIDTWRTILDTVIDDVQECVLEGNAGGMHFANSTWGFYHLATIECASKQRWS